jgi:ferredoxin-NADP reductase/predicted pyridoxine 5'-phosphate oxidase superfamily flavin-nucleotide-binding protein
MDYLAGAISGANSSPFHQGEHEAQNRLGVRDQMERFGSRVIREFMPDQHRDFYRHLPFVFVGHADRKGWPWASILFNTPGFMTSENEKTLSIKSKPVDGDPLAESLDKGTRLGLLGIELTSRRRNRLAAHIVDSTVDHLQLEIDQAFGNCPQYIQTRELETIDTATMPAPQVHEFQTFDERSKTLIANSDTFFVASYVQGLNNSSEVSEGADVSHRGGQPGFVRIDDDNTLTIPDYLGNYHFNTFGNFIENPKAGLLFIDFENGHLLTLTGTVEILWDSPDTKHFEGAERLWKFRLDHGRFLEHALPLRWKLDQFSPNSLMTGTWDQAEKRQQAAAQKNQWLPYTVSNITRESEVISSFYLEAKGHQPAKFVPGQFLTVKAPIDGRDHIRTYTLSSAPLDTHYRISVKREETPGSDIPAGLFSNHIHDQLQIGDVLYAKAPCGAFTFDAAQKRPAVLLAGGVGITPMVSMAKHAFNEAIRTRSGREITFIGAAKNHEQRAFFDELNQIAETSEGQVSVFWSLSEVNPQLILGKDFHQQGRISLQFLQGILPLADYDFYLCGPTGFMQSTYDILRTLGVSDGRIYAEEFGPAALKRDADHATTKFTPAPIAAEAIIEFTESKVEQAWTEADGSLLDFAEAHGFTPEFGCRSGQCGACKTSIVSGKVAYQTDHSSSTSDNEVLLCCAVPAAIDGEDVVRLRLKL